MKLTILALYFSTLLLTPFAHGGQITVSPAAISLKGSAGQATTQTFRVRNFTDSVLRFVVEISDVKVKDGKRIFIPADQATESLASMSIAALTTFELQPGEEQLVPVTFVLPRLVTSRALVVFFCAQQTQAVEGPRIQMNLGVVVDFSISDEVDLRLDAPEITPPTVNTNALVTERMANEGPEPANVRGIAAFLDAHGKIVGKATFDHKRLLPGEQDALHAEYPGALSSGLYRVLCSLEYGGRTVTKSTEFIVP